MSETTANVAPIASEPESPMNTCAGWTLNHRKPSRAPMISAHRMARLVCPPSRAMIMYATKAKMSVPPARPSRPSVKFTPLLVATIVNAAKRTQMTGSIGTSPMNGTVSARML